VLKSVWGKENAFTLVVGMQTSTAAMDREAWRAEVHGVAKNRTRLSN